MDEITQLLTRGVDTIYPVKEDLEKVLRSGKKLTLYQGFDPTGTQLHIGHMVGFRKLAQWQKLGHKVIFLIGTGTGLAGDPSGKKRAREKFLSEDELKQNAKDYVMQASKIVDFDGDNPIQIVYNGDWLNKLTLAEILDIAGHFTVQQLIERDLFQERIKENAPINLREFLYPLLQGYDSVAMKVDLELGGTDQTFNMLAGRQLVKDYLNKEKFVMTTPLLTDSNGIKIGKSEGNVIGLTDKPSELFYKIMMLPDDTVGKSFEYLTDLPMDEVNRISQEMAEGKNPLVHKKKLSFEIVKQLNTQEQAGEAQREYENVKERKNAIPSQRLLWNPTFTIASNASISNALVASGVSPSMSWAKDVITSGGTASIQFDTSGEVGPQGPKISEKKITDPKTPLLDVLNGKNEGTIRVGSKYFDIKVEKDK